MTLLAVILALIVEQMQALPVGRVVRDPVARFFGLLERHFNDGRYDHGVIAWSIAVLLPSALLGAGYGVLLWQEAFLAFLLGVASLYLTVGFRQFSHHFTEIQQDLRNDDIEGARRHLALWRGSAGERLSGTEVARISIEIGLVASHRYVFAPIFWFVAIGPAGALMYRLAQMANDAWGSRRDEDMGRFGEFARRAFSVVDWLPVRLTAAAFAVVGDFEDAVHCWRTQSANWPDRGGGILLATGAGALGVRLGLPVTDVVGGELAGDAGNDRPELGLGDDADADFMQSTIGLVWRTLVLVLLVLALIAVSGWMGA